MSQVDLTGVIQWRVHLRSPREAVYAALATDSGRRSFWAAAAPEVDGVIHFAFANGMTFKGRVLEKRPPARFAVTYFGGSRAQFDLVEDGRGGTDLTLTESGVPEANRLLHLPGWIPVLLGLKAAVDFAIDLRNHDPERSWEHGFVDV